MKKQLDAAAAAPGAAAARKLTFAVAGHLDNFCPVEESILRHPQLDRIFCKNPPPRSTREAQLKVLARVT